MATPANTNINEGVTTVTNNATDSGCTTQILTYTLVTAPGGARPHDQRRDHVDAERIARPRAPT